MSFLHEYLYMSMHEFQIFLFFTFLYKLDCPIKRLLVQWENKLLNLFQLSIYFNFLHNVRMNQSKRNVVRLPVTGACCTVCWGYLGSPNNFWGFLTFCSLVSTSQSRFHLVHFGSIFRIYWKSFEKYALKISNCPLNRARWELPESLQMHIYKW